MLGIRYSDVIYEYRTIKNWTRDTVRMIKVLLLVSLVYVLHLPQASPTIILNPLSHVKLPYDLVNGVPQYGLFEGAAHKAAYDKRNRKLYVISKRMDSRDNTFLHILNLNDVKNPRAEYSHTFNHHQLHGPTDIAICTHPTNINADVVAITMPARTTIYPGVVEIFEPYFKDSLKLIRTITVGRFPKSLAFTRDCGQIIVANEGIPGLDGTEQTSAFIDPPGSVSIITSPRDTYSITNLDFSKYDGIKEQYMARGVRYVFRGDHRIGVSNTFSQDMEPEDVTVDPNDQFAYITLMENNAIAKLDLNTRSFVDLYPAGVKNYSSFNIDASDKDGGYHPERYPIYGMHQPSVVKIGVLNNKPYLITADQGAIKTVNYTSNQQLNTFSDAVRGHIAIRDGMTDSILLDPTVRTALGDDAKLGRLHISTEDGVDPTYRQINEVYTFGGRGLSLIDASTMQMTYNTGHDLETNDHQFYSDVFNGDCSSSSATPKEQADSRSDDFGPEPSALTIGNTESGVPVIVSGGRGGILSVFSLRNGASMVFESNIRSGSTNRNWQTLYNNNDTGDGLISDLGFIYSVHSTHDKPVVFAIGIQTGTVGLYELDEYTK